MAFACVLASRAYAQCQYEVTIIHPPICPGGGVPEVPITSPADISETGVIVGEYGQCSNITRQEAFMWSEETGFVTLPRPAGCISAQALAISSDGSLIVGQMEIPGSAEPSVAFVYLNGQMISLGALKGDNTSFATGVSNSGVIAGQSQNPLTPDPIDAVRWTHYLIEELFAPAGESSRAEDINVTNVIVGRLGAGNVALNATPVLWNNGVLEVLDTTGFHTAKADCINDSELIGGTGYLKNPEPGTLAGRPVLWKHRTIDRLPILSGAIASHIIHISNNSVASGSNTIGGEGGRATIWIDGQVVDLNNQINDERVYRLEWANALNSNGWIACKADLFIGQLTGSAIALLKPIGSPPGDLNKDCIVNTLDLEILFEQWNRADSFADIDESGNVDVHDLFKLLAGWG